jgi:hypothetical protein
MSVANIETGARQARAQGTGRQHAHAQKKLARLSTPVTRFAGFTTWRILIRAELTGSP